MLDEFFYLLVDYISLSGISNKKKIKIKIEFEPKMYKICGTLDVIYIGDIYSKKEVNFNPEKNHLMCNYFNLNDLKGWQGFVENTWNNFFF